MDTWMPFLEARMALIKECLAKGRSELEIYNQLQVDDMQVKILCMTARREMAK